MSHPAQLEFVELARKMFPDAFYGKKVLEVGSLDINGSIRDLFIDCDYLGIDVAPGKGVDLVCEAQNYDASDGAFDTVISCEAMEHNPYWKETFINMLRLCKPGGLVLMTCATAGRQEHGTSRTSPEASPLTVGLGWDYYRNLTSADFEHAINIQEATWPYRFFTNWRIFDLYFVGFRTGSDNIRTDVMQRKLNAMRRYYFWEHVRTLPRQFNMRVAIAILGAERYWAGPIRSWWPT